MRRIAVIDSQVLINLVHLHLAEKLVFYFDAVYVPRRVQEEVNKKRRFRRLHLSRLFRRGLFRRCAFADETNVRLLIPPLDRGEAERLVQAREREVKFVITDDLDARRISERQGLTPIGTARLLARLHLEGHAEDAKLLVYKLRRDLRCRISDVVVEEAIASAHLAI
jgi:predicted nucleic acid-binding protein